MKKACAVFLKIIMIVCLTVAASKAQSKKKVIEADTVKTKVLKVNNIYTDTIKIKKSEKPPSKYEDSKPVQINFKKRKLYKLPDLKEGDFYHLQIDDINMNLYTVTHQSKDSVITSNITFPTFDIPGLETLEKLLEGLSPANKNSVLVEEDLADTVKGIDKTVQEVEDITETLNRHVADLNTKKIKIQKLAQEIDTLMLDVRTMALSYLVDRDTTWQQELKGDLDFKKFIDESEEYRIKVYKLLTKLKQKRTGYLDFYEDNKEIISKNSELRKTDENIKGAFTAAINHLDKTFQAINVDKVSEWLTTIIHLDNNKTRSYTSLPIQLKGDFTDLSIDIKPKDEKFGLPSYHTNLRFPDPSGWKVGLSSGFYYSKLADEEYSVTASQIDSVTANVELTNENPSNWEVGSAVLFHWNLSNVTESLEWEKIQIHLTIGPGLSFSKPIKPRILAGGGFAFGKNHKLALSVLAAFGAVDRLSNNYSEFRTETVDIEEIPKNLTVSKFKGRFGLSLGYIYDF